MELAHSIADPTLTEHSTVFVVDDDDDMRNSLTRTIRSVGLNVEAYASPSEFLAAYNPERPGCLVLDLRLPEMNGIELYELLRARGCRYPFLVITGHGDVGAAVDAMQRGALDFIEKPFSRQRLLDQVHRAIERDEHNRQQMSEHLYIKTRLESLTAREREVLDLVIQGRLSREIAAELNISPKTVEVHRSKIVKKMGVDSVAQLVGLVMKYQRAEEALSGRPMQPR